MDNSPKTLRFYRRPDGKVPVRDWLQSFEDKRTRRRIEQRILRLSAGNAGDFKKLDGGLIELRLDFGPGYRLYLGESGNEFVILLLGGDKRSQRKDILRALEYWLEYQSSERSQP